jgi:hypothetical protein
VHDVPPVAEVVARLRAEYEHARAGTAALAT